MQLEAAAAGGSAGSGANQGLGDSTTPTRHQTGDVDTSRDCNRDKDREDGAPFYCTTYLNSRQAWWRGSSPAW